MSARRLRSTTLLWIFTALSPLLLALGGLTLGARFSSTIRGQAVEDARDSLTQYVDGVLAAHLATRSGFAVRRRLPVKVQRQLANRSDIQSVKVWRRDGVLAWTNRGTARIGRRFPLDGPLAEALKEGRTEAEFEDLRGSSRVEHVGEVRAGIDRALEVYTPVRSPQTHRIIGAYEIYMDSRGVESAIADRTHRIWLVTGAVFAILWLALVLLVRMASILMRRQTTLLRERSEALAASVGQLERSSLESIETLNATVDAKDPYTAGHSQRVQRVALAIGAELRLPAEELHALGLAGLLHDIGKIAVPDAILTKPGRLTEEEFDQMKLHPTQGARIVGKLEQLRVTVPLIRHHHERWDGRGYPDGLAGGEIPELATVVALADAWDAMTTDRPYAAALSTEVALAEVRAGRETQFAPTAVDAFLAVAHTGPEELGISRAERVGALVA